MLLCSYFLFGHLKKILVPNGFNACSRTNFRAFIYNTFNYNSGKNGMNRNIQIYYCNSFLTKPCSSNVHYHMTSRPGLKYHHAIKSINNWFTDFRKRYDVHNNVAYMMTKV